jgi:hypothetical protein
VVIVTKDIEDLISLGSKIENLNNELLFSFKKRDYVNRQNIDTWNNLVRDVSDNDLILIFKALVTLERKLKWIGGSVAGAIWIYRIIIQRHLDNDYKIADYGLKNCDNPWVPFGGSYYGKRTIGDYFAYKEEKSRISAIKAKQYVKILRRVEGRKERRVSAIAELRKLTYAQRGQIRKELFFQHEKSSTFERLTIIADDEKYPPEYYPREWIKLSIEEIQKLPIELIKRLYDKLSTKTKGDWKRFSQKLKNLDDGI